MEGVRAVGAEDVRREVKQERDSGRRWICSWRSWRGAGGVHGEGDRQEGKQQRGCGRATGVMPEVEMEVGGA